MARIRKKMINLDLKYFQLNKKKNQILITYFPIHDLFTKLEILKTHFYKNADFITFTNNGSVFSSGMILYSNSSGGAWAGSNRIYDFSALKIWNVSGGVITTVFEFC
jgi:hypothetical protein